MGHRRCYSAIDADTADNAKYARVYAEGPEHVN
jgi:hypothetical protein